MSILRAELILAERRLEKQAKALKETEAAFDAMAKKGLSASMQVLQTKLARQKLAYEQTGKYVAELRETIANEDSPQMDLDKESKRKR